MTNEVIKDGIQSAGDIDIQEITLICFNGVQVDLKPFLVELNLTEDIFSPSIYGNIMLSDSLGLIEKCPIVGEEYIRINVVTPSTDTHIYKTFRVYHLSDRNIVMDDKTQNFTLHFCSSEVFVDTMGKIYKTFSGRIDQVANTIYENYLKAARNIVVNPQTNQFVDSDEKNPLTILNETDNNVAFTSPGWGAMKCLTWLASKSISKDTKSSDSLFYETSQGFYFGSIGAIMQAFKDSKTVAASFYYTPSNIISRPTDTISVSGVQYAAPDLNHEYKIMQNFTILDSFNTLKSNQNGFYANQVLAVDLINKTYKYNNFDYVQDFDKYPHMDKYPPFTANQFRNPNMVTQVAYKSPNLFTGTTMNVNERVAEIRQNRMSLLAGLNNIRIEGTVPGRTNLQAGCVVYFAMPKMGPKDGQDKAETYDMYMSGLYLISCIRHKINLYRHTMNLEMVKDSFATQLA